MIVKFKEFEVELDDSGVVVAVKPESMDWIIGYAVFDYKDLRPGIKMQLYDPEHPKNASIKTTSEIIEVRE